MTRDEMLKRMSSSEFHEWKVLEEIEPFGEMGAWLRSALTTCVLANAHRGPNTRAFVIEDFMPVVEEEQSQTSDEMLAFMMGLKMEQDVLLRVQK